MDLFSSPPPLAPPTSEEDILSRLRLLRSRRVGASTYHRLMQAHGDNAQNALDALHDAAADAGIKNYEPCPPGVVRAELKAGRAAGAVPLVYGQPGYPPMLYNIADAPPFLWALGDLSLLRRPAISLVGARNASSLGRRMARALSTGLGEAGCVVISGLARGIDTHVHQAALDTGTIAVVAGGIDVVYPRENAELTAEIAQKGLILTEMPPGLQPQARHFPRRNRIIAGLAHGVVVVEAAMKSGSLITARDALDLGRDVLAVPGHPFDPRASGCNMLIRDGATLVRGSRDVLDSLPSLETPAEDEHLPPHVAAEQTPPHLIETPPGVPAQHRAAQKSDTPQGEAPDLRASILGLLGPAPLAEDQILRDLSLSGHEAAGILLDLEMEGLVERLPGGLLALSA